MIYTDHQLQVTTNAVAKFRAGIKELSLVPKEEIKDLELHEIYIRALRQQAERLEAEKAKYELIRSGNVEIEVTSVSDLGISLVNARIKAGMTRATLAKQLKVSENEIVSNEVNQYKETSIDEIRKTASVLNVKIPEEVIPSPSRFNGKIKDILTKLRRAGFDQKFVLSRLILPNSLEKVKEQSKSMLDKYTLGLCTHLKRVFELTWDQLIDFDDLTNPIAKSAGEKFKVEPNHNLEKINVYSKYAHYLASVATNGAKSLIKKNIPTNAIKMRKAIIDSYGLINFENTLKYAWDCGVIVIPLNDKGSFNAVCIRVEGRNVIILNPKKLFNSFWLFDLLHELSHAGQEPEKESFDEIEAVPTSHERRTSKEEIEANNFANAVIFGKNAINLFNQCIERADGKLNLLKKAIQAVAQENNVKTDLLANYVTHKAIANSSFKKKELRAMADSLQLKEENPYELAVDIFFDRFPFTMEAGIDQSLLLQALEDV